MNVAVVGSNGFIGRVLTERLKDETNINLHLFGRGSQSVFGDELPYSPIQLLNQELLRTQFKNIDYVYYLISETIPASSWNSPLSEIEKNLRPFVHFCEAISDLSIKKIIFVSSAGTIYGPSTNKLSEEADKQPFSPYGITKLSMEYFLNYIDHKYNIKHDVFRVSNVYGEGQNTGKGLGIINTFIEKIITDGVIQIFGTGEITRNYIYVRDVAEYLACSVLIPADTSNVYNLSSDDTLKINEVVEVLRNVIPSPFSVHYSAARMSDNSAIELDNTKLKKSFPHLKMTSIENGIAKTFQEIKKLLLNKNG